MACLMPLTMPASKAAVLGLTRVIAREVGKGWN